jgi:hypothetical protein
VIQDLKDAAGYVLALLSLVAVPLLFWIATP